MCGNHITIPDATVLVARLSVEDSLHEALTVPAWLADSGRQLLTFLKAARGDLRLFLRAASGARDTVGRERGLFPMPCVTGSSVVSLVPALASWLPASRSTVVDFACCAVVALNALAGFSISHRARRATPRSAPRRR